VINTLVARAADQFRIGALGNPHQTLLTPEPVGTTQLPSQDIDWDAQALPQARCTLYSPPESLGRYAGVVQASHILSCVMRHISDTSRHAGSQMSNVEQLGRTVFASLEYAEAFTGKDYSMLCFQRAIANWFVKRASTFLDISFTDNEIVPF
jgi:hypothetical protein